MHGVEDEHQGGADHIDDSGEGDSGKPDGDDQDGVSDEDGVGNEDGADDEDGDDDEDGADNEDAGDDAGDDDEDGGDDSDRDADYLPPGSPHVEAVHGDIVSSVLCAIVFVRLLTILFEGTGE